jgi:hypothetical protein
VTYRCSVCKKRVEGDLLVYIDHTERHIMEEIRANHPDWAEKSGLCQKCVDYYRHQIKGDGSVVK